MTRRKAARPRPVLAQARPTEQPRVIREFSRKSRRRALLHLRNATCYSWAVGLTFPRPVLDDRLAKLALDRFALWVVRQGVSLFWKQEFSSGKPHFHMLMTGPLNEGEASRVWASATGSSHVNVYSKPIRVYDALVQYMLKRPDHPQNQIPEGYRNMGRFWGTRGPKAKADALLEIRGQPVEIAKLVRPLKRVEKAAKKRKRPDGGSVGMTMYDCGGHSVAEALKKCIRQ